MDFKYALLLVACIIATVFTTLFVDRHYLNPQQADVALNKEHADRMLNQLTEIRQSLQRIERNQAQDARRPSTPKTASASTKGRPTLGAPDARITVVEFTDYQCPFCSRFERTTFKQLKSAYIDTGKVRWVVLDMPLSFHADAMYASQAAHCAAEQDKFWQLRELLFQNQNKLKAEHIASYAAQVGIDTAPFNQCINSDRYKDDIKRDLSKAGKQNITGTPTFVIGKTTADEITGRRIVGAQSYSTFSKAIEALLETDAGKVNQDR